jgi:hypothetical protein
MAKALITGFQRIWFAVEEEGEGLGESVFA